MIGIYCSSSSERKQKGQKTLSRNYEDHIKNMDDIEKGLINFPLEKTYINWGDGENIKESIIIFKLKII